MRIDLRCVPCNMQAMLRIMDENSIEREEQITVMSGFLRKMAKMDLDSETPIDIGRNVGESLELVFKGSDPFREIKKASNKALLEIYDQLKQRLLRLPDPLKAAIKLSVAGNIIDFAPGHRIDIDRTLEQALSQQFALDDLDLLVSRIRSTPDMLIIGDNCGEAVLDKLLMEIAAVPETYFAVRSKPALNDITMKEALEIGLDEVATLVDSGAEAPGAQEKSMSTELARVYSKASIVISKGQGNLEGLSSAEREVFFLLMAKCEVIASFLGVKKGSFVAYRKA